MNLKERIQNDKAVAMKSGNKELNVLLGTIIGECDRFSKTPSDDEVIRIIKKMIESSKLCGIESEAKLLEVYLPQMVGIDELTENITDFCINNNITEKKDMGKVMNFLKATFPGRYDGKLASIIISNCLK